MNDETEKLLKYCLEGGQLSVNQCVYLFENASLSQLAWSAHKIRTQKNKNIVYFVQNQHIEPTNVCVFQCRFCSFSVVSKEKGWSKSHAEIIQEVKQLNNSVKELHIVGGANPDYNLDFYSLLLKEIKKLRPDIHIKAFTAAEIQYMSQLDNIGTETVLATLKEAGLNSMPGGGAEIFNPDIRSQICPDKLNAQQWLSIHNKAHLLGIPSNATLLYGHLETPLQRFEHMEMIRNLQKETGGFNAFIPLKFKNRNNQLSYIQETGIIEDLKMFALSRLFFNNIEHLKVYWPAFGKQFASIVLAFGADDLDGTIQNSTKIYSLAGSDEENPEMSCDEAKTIIQSAGFMPVERDALYNSIV